MKIIKLNAIDSTNSFLKNMTAKIRLDNFTVVVAREQTLGRGQMNANWQSQVGKNLTFSVFCRFKNLCVTDYKYLNYSISLSLYKTINTLDLPRLFIKWPNDILSENKKIAGILIENTLNANYISSSIIGIGLNVNQDKFSDELSNASSVKMILDKKEDINLDALLNKILLNLKEKLNQLNEKSYESLEKEYLSVLYKKNVPSMFKTNQNILFMGKIVGVSGIGNLQIGLDNETIQEFGVKEISFA